MGGSGGRRAVMTVDRASVPPVELYLAGTARTRQIGPHLLDRPQGRPLRLHIDAGTALYRLRQLAQERLGVPQPGRLRQELQRAGSQGLLLIDGIG